MKYWRNWLTVNSFTSNFMIKGIKPIQRRRIHTSWASLLMICILDDMGIFGFSFKLATNNRDSNAVIVGTNTSSWGTYLHWHFNFPIRIKSKKPYACKQVSRQYAYAHLRVVILKPHFLSVCFVFPFFVSTDLLAGPYPAIFLNSSSVRGAPLTNRSPSSLPLIFLRAKISSSVDFPAPLAPTLANTNTEQSIVTKRKVRKLGFRRSNK